MTTERFKRNDIFILGYGYYRREIEEPIFHQYPLAKYAAKAGAMSIQNTLSQRLNRLQQHEYLERIPDTGSQLIEDNPYLPKLIPGRPERKYFQVTDAGTEFFIDQLVQAVTNMGESFHDLFKSEDLTRYMVGHPVVRQAVWGAITGLELPQSPYNTPPEL